MQQKDSQICYTLSQKLWKCHLIEVCVYDLLPMGKVRILFEYMYRPIRDIRPDMVACLNQLGPPDQWYSSNQTTGGLGVGGTFYILIQTLSTHSSPVVSKQATKNVACY
jgi:hypothetical protein